MKTMKVSAEVLKELILREHKQIMSEKNRQTEIEQLFGLVKPSTTTQSPVVTESVKPSTEVEKTQEFEIKEMSLNEAMTKNLQWDKFLTEDFMDRKLNKKKVLKG